MRSLPVLLLLALPCAAAEVAPDRRDGAGAHGVTGLRLVPRPDAEGRAGPTAAPDPRWPMPTAEGLAWIILDGVPGTAMPPWRPLLTEAEALWIAHYLKKD